MKNALSSFSPALIYVSISLVNFSFSPYSVKRAKTCRRGQKANRFVLNLFAIYVSIQIIINSASYEYCELE